MEINNVVSYNIQLSYLVLLITSKLNIQTCQNDFYKYEFFNGSYIKKTMDFLYISGNVKIYNFNPNPPFLNNAMSWFPIQNQNGNVIIYNFNPNPGFFYYASKL